MVRRRQPCPEPGSHARRRRVFCCREATGMTVRRWSDEDRAAALQLLRDGVGTNETARRSGVPAATLSRWAKDAGIVVDRPAHTAVANEATRLKWAQRREQIPDEVGAVLKEILEKCRGSESGRDAHGFAMAYGTLID